MAHSKVTICNSALGLLGKPPLVEDVEGPQQWDEADVVVRAYDERFGRILRSHNWNFAETLTKLEAAGPPPKFGFARKFPLPSDCAKVWSLDKDLYGPEPKYKVRDGHIETDLLAPLNVIYIKRVTDPSLFDDEFAEALAVAIAAKSAVAVLGSIEAADWFRRNAKEDAAEARHSDAKENPALEFGEGTWLVNRRTG